MQCPRCDGKGETWGWACPGFRYIALPCHVCDGTGEVDDGYPERLERGQAMRKARVERRETMREAAQRLGISVVAYSHMEWGIVDAGEAA